MMAFLGLLLFLRPFYDRAQEFDLGAIGDLEKASVIYDRQGKELGRMYVQNRRPVTLDEIPFYLVQAMTATEDSRYFKHNGIDYFGIFRAAFRNLRKSGSARARRASTITMQLGRDAYGLKGGLERKITEAFLARRIEKRISKAKILELYLNRIYFGEGYHGISSAAEGYFGKPVKDLTMGESAILAGMPKSPNAYSPRRYPSRSKERRDYVLGRMVIEDMISAEERDLWQETPIRTAAKVTEEEWSNYVYEQIRQRVVDNLGNQRALSGGFHIYTTIDSKLQAAAEKAVLERLQTIEERPQYRHQTYQQFRRIIDDYEQKLTAEEIHPSTKRPSPDYLQAAALTIDNKTGAVRALIGGRNFADSEYDRALLAKRAVGTAFTPIVFASAFEEGSIYPGTLLKDTPIDNRRVMIGGLTGILGEWGLEASGQDYSNKEVTARDALVQSMNAATVRLGEQVGLDRLKETAARLGISSPIKDFPASYLGSSGASLAEMTLAYTAFPQGGKRPASMYFIRKIIDDNERTIYQKEKPEESALQVISPTAAYQVHSCLVEVPKKGTAANVAELGLTLDPVAGKTGTHYNFKDLWFLGYSNQLTSGVWVGFDQPRTIFEKAFSNALALPIWVDIMNASSEDYPPAPFSRPAGLKTVEICKRSGHAATDACYEQKKNDQGRLISVRTTYSEVVGSRVRLRRFCDLHSGEPVASQILAVALEPKEEEPPSLMPGAGNGFGGGVQLVSPTVIGEDPYQAFQPTLKAVAMLPVGENDGTSQGYPLEVKRATTMRSAYLGNPKYQIRLKPPRPVEIID